MVHKGYIGLIVVTAIIIGCIFISGCLERSKENVILELTTYEDAERGIRIEYPVSWTKLENSTKGTLVSFMPDENDTHYGVFTVFLSVNISLDPAIFLDIRTMYPNITFTDLYKMYLGLKFTNFSMLDGSSTLLANRTAYSVFFTFKEDGRTFKRLDTWTSDALFLLLYQAEETYYGNYIGTVEKMIDSFEIL